MLVCWSLADRWEGNSSVRVHRSLYTIVLFIQGISCLFLSLELSRANLLRKSCDHPTVTIMPKQNYVHA